MFIVSGLKKKKNKNCMFMLWFMVDITIVIRDDFMVYKPTNITKLRGPIL
jgi:hypothetical protein